MAVLLGLMGILPNPEFVFCDIFKVKFEKMRKPAVTAPDGEMPAANDDIMRTVDMAVSATCLFKKVPYIIASDSRECPRFGDILNAGNKNASGTAVVTGNLSFVGYCLDYLICNLPAMVTVSAIFCENELFAHENYWMLSRFINLLHLTIKPGSRVENSLWL